MFDNHSLMNTFISFVLPIVIPQISWSVSLYKNMENLIA